MTSVLRFANEIEAINGLRTSPASEVESQLKIAFQRGVNDLSASESGAIDPVSSFAESILAAEKGGSAREDGLVEINDGQGDISAEQYFPHIKSCGCSACKGNALEAESQSGQGQVDGTQSDLSELLAPGDLVSESFGDITKDYLGSSEILYYHIFDYEFNVEDYLGSGSALQTWDHLDDATDFIHDIFLELDPLIGLDFQYTENLEESHLTILSVKDWNYWEDSTLGQVIDLDSSWHVLWKDTNVDSLGGDSSGASDGNDANTIIHEIGHALGLSHPKEDPNNPSWNTDDTVMSYNISPDGWDYSFSELDIAALQSIWGTEANEAPSPPDSPAVLSSAAEDSTVTITSTSLLEGFSDAEGDELSIENLSATNGSLTDNNNGTWSFTPNGNFSGTVDLTYAVIDGNGGSIDASNSFEITAINDAPLLSGSQASLLSAEEDSTVTFSADTLLEGFSDPEGDALSISNLTANNGTLTDNNDGTWSFSPNPNFSGTVSLTYAVIDGNGGSVDASNSFEIASDSSYFVLTGTEGADTATGGDSNDSISGLGGNDLINGKAGDDTLIGGTGNDQLDGSFGNDTLYGGSGDDTLTDTPSSGNGSNLLDGGDGNDNLTARSLGGNQTLVGGAGQDTLNATGQNLNLDGGADNDNLSITGRIELNEIKKIVVNGNANLVGGKGDDTLNASTYFQAELDGGDGDDNLSTSGVKQQTLRGGDGNDKLTTIVNVRSDSGDGGTNNNRQIDRDILLDGGNGNDIIRISRNTFLEGSDTGSGQTNINITGGDGDDDITVSNGSFNEWDNSYLPHSKSHGFASVNIDTGSGNDSIKVIGGLQIKLSTGDGADTVHLTSEAYQTIVTGTRRFLVENPVGNIDWRDGESDNPSDHINIDADPILITDFTTGADGDVLDYSDLLDNSALNYQGNNPFSNGYLTLTQSGSDTLIRFDADGNGGSDNSLITIAVLQNVNVDQLSNNNFKPEFDPTGNDDTSATLVNGSELADTLSGGLGADSISGLGGNDLINGKAGDDTLIGGTGNDQLDGSFGNDTLYGGSGDDTLTDTPSSGNGSNLLDGGDGNDNLTARSLGGNQTLVGGAGQDTLNATGQNLNLDGGADNDNLSITGRIELNEIKKIVVNGNANLVGGKGDDTLNASTYFQAELDGGDGDDNLSTSGVKQQTLRGGDGNDKLTTIVNVRSDSGDGGTNNNRQIDRDILLDGGNGNDIIRISRNTFLEGSDTGSGQTNINITGGDGDDDITVSNGSFNEWDNSYLPHSKSHGFASVNIDTGSGNDSIKVIGGLQIKLSTGDGADTVHLTSEAYQTIVTGTRRFLVENPVGNIDWRDGESDNPSDHINIDADPILITDFTTGADGDVLDYSDLLDNSALNYQGNNPFSNGYLTLTQSGSDTLIRFDADGNGGSDNSLITIAVLQNVNVDQLSNNNFKPEFALDGNDDLRPRLITGTDVSETIYGALGADTINGNGGDDLIDGSAGDDSLTGGDGNDTLIGGIGEDTAVFTKKLAKYEINFDSEMSAFSISESSRKEINTDFVQEVELFTFGANTFTHQELIAKIAIEEEAPTPAPIPAPAQEAAPAPAPAPSGGGGTGGGGSSPTPASVPASVVEALVSNEPSTPTPTPSSVISEQIPTPITIATFDSDPNVDPEVTQTTQIQNGLFQDELVNFDAGDIANLEPEALQELTANQISQIDKTAVAGFSPKQIYQLPADSIVGLTKSHIANLVPQAIKGFRAEQIEQLSKKVFKALNTSQLAQLSKDAITGLTMQQLKTLSGKELLAFKPSQIQSIDPEGISGIKPKALNALSNRQIKSMIDEQLEGLSKKQLRKANDFLEALSSQQRDVLFFGLGRSSRLGDSLSDVDELDLIPGLDPLA